MSGRLLVIAAGGTGGHMFPAQALAEEMLGRGWRVTCTTDARGMRYTAVYPEAVELVETSAATFARGGLGAKLRAPFAILRGIQQMRARFLADPPACVAGFGGYPALPALAAAWSLDLPRIIHEQNGVLGRVNRLFAARVDRVACGTWPVVNAPKGARLVHVGNPLRAAAFERQGTPYTPPGEGEIRLLVFGGSQGASVFARLLPPALADLPEAVRARIRLTQQARDGEETAFAEACRAAGIEAEVRPFFEDMPRRITEAHLVVARAGASSLAEIAAIGRPALLVPYPHAMDDHQSANAAAMDRAGAATVIREADATTGRLAAELRRLLAADGGDDALAAMAAAALQLARPAAAKELGDLVQELAAAPRA